MKIAECLTKEHKQQLNRMRSIRQKPPNQIDRQRLARINGSLSRHLQKSEWCSEKEIKNKCRNK